MTDPQNADLAAELAMLQFLVHELMVGYCLGKPDPVAFAEALSAQIDASVAKAPRDEPNRHYVAERLQTFFAQVVSTLRTQSSRHNA